MGAQDLLDTIGKNVDFERLRCDQLSLNLPTEDRFIRGVRYLRVDVTDDEVKKYAIKDFDYIVNLGGYINHKPFLMVVKYLISILLREKLS